MDKIYSRIKKGEILVGDGAWGTLLIQAGLQPGECPELWSITKPEKIREIAAKYKDAGADIVSTNTFGGNRIKLKMYGLEDKAKEINRVSSYLSRSAVGDETHVLASIGPCGKLVMMGEVSMDELYESFKEQAMALEEGGADACIIETMSDLEEAKCALRAVQENTELEVVLSFTFSKSADGHNYFTMMGVTPSQVISEFGGMDVKIIGANCSLGAEDICGVISEYYQSEKNISYLVYPNAGQPHYTEEGIKYPETPEVFKTYVPKYIEHGARIIGGCCGTTYEHIRAIRKVVDSL
ncbi:MAG: homocysteine S-methyltransferase family protein [Candidatus Hydrogenedentes bacterium]|nr:homocysteine S-methyltransferase family protein [Candidatus Hydrogenedentota bacterium]